MRFTWKNSWREQNAWWAPRDFSPLSLDGRHVSEEVILDVQPGWAFKWPQPSHYLTANTLETSSKNYPAGSRQSPESWEIINCYFKPIIVWWLDSSRTPGSIHAASECLPSLVLLGRTLASIFAKTNLAVWSEQGLIPLEKLLLDVTLDMLTRNHKIKVNTSLVAQTVKNLPIMQETRAWSQRWEDPLEKRMDTHSSILAWRILIDWHFHFHREKVPWELGEKRGLIQPETGGSEEEVILNWILNAKKQLWLCFIEIGNYYGFLRRKVCDKKLISGKLVWEQCIHTVSCVWEILFGNGLWWWGGQ